MENHGTDWRKPWTDRAHNYFPNNVASHKDYRGINVPILLCSPFGSNTWGSYKQWQAIGAQVRKGEKATSVVWWSTGTSRDPSGDNDEESGKARRWVSARFYPIFNADQVDGYAPKIKDPLPEPERNATVDAWVAHTKATIRHGGNRAFYTTGGDHIQMPLAGQFASSDGYYATLLHELTHWTGNKARCNREFGARFGDKAYAFEELVAELGAAFLCLKLGVTDEPREDHGKYLKGWLSHLKEDPQAILTAFSKTQQAVDYLDQLQPGAKKEDEAEPIAA
jgi:antirestriction protein ArdC